MSPAVRSRPYRLLAAVAATAVGLGAWLQAPLVADAQPATPPFEAGTPSAVAGASTELVSVPARGEAARLRPYRGLASWVDIHDSRAWDHPKAVVREMSAHGVRTIFVETANAWSTLDVFRPPALNRLVNTAHRKQMRVVAWYLPSFVNLKFDLRRSLAAINYRTQSGQYFDGFALDIESPEVRPVTKRIKRLLRLSERIRATVGRSYSLGAITPSPRGMKRKPVYWGPLQDFPFAPLARIYDVIAPMGYYTYRTRGATAAYRYTAFNIRAVRRISGDSSVPIHSVGGLGRQSSTAEVRAFVRAVRQGDVLGGSLYDFVSTAPRHWRELQRIPY